jgi:hypothetical protein
MFARGRVEQAMAGVLTDDVDEEVVVRSIGGDTPDREVPGAVMVDDRRPDGVLGDVERRDGVAGT